MAGKIRYLNRRGDRYEARVTVPVKLRHIIGKRELLAALGNDRQKAIRNLSAAVAAHQAKITATERQLAGASARTRFPMTSQQMAVSQYEELAKFDLEIRSHPDYARLSDIEIDDILVADLRKGMAGGLLDDDLDRLVGYRLERFRKRGNFDAAKGSEKWRVAAQNLCVAEFEALNRKVERDEGDFAGTPAHPLLVNVAAPDLREPVSLKGLLDSYLKEMEHGGRGRESRRRWTPVFERLVSFLESDNAREFTAERFDEWHEGLRESLAEKTIRDVYLASTRAVLKWAKRKRLIDFNPAEHAQQRVARPIRTREKGFREAESLAIIKATRDYVRPERESEKMAAAKRWAPVLCAFTGARVSEITQLRKQDIWLEGGVWTARISPEAGSVKTGNFRDVPLHDQIIELGFSSFVKDAPKGPMFHTAQNSDKALARARTAANRVGAWLHTLKLVPDGVDPNYGWRHRFKTISLELELSHRIIDAIQGHAARTAGETYGDVTLKAKKLTIDRLPRFAL